MATTLAQYYASKGQSLPTVSQRQEIASQAGISGYTGTAQQNTQLLKFLQNQQTPVNNILLPNSPLKPENNPAFNLGQIPSYIPPVNQVINQQTPSPIEIPKFETLQAQPMTEEDILGSRIGTLRNEITDIERKMSETSVNRTGQLETAGVFEDMRRLNDLKDQLRKAQDRQIEIPLETENRLQGTTATMREFGQTTRPQLRDAALSELIASRQTSRLTDTINTNIAIVDNYIQQEKDRNEFLYSQKIKELDNVEKLYGNLMSEKQKMALEERKYAIDLEKNTIDAWNKEKQALMDHFIKKEDYAMAQRIGSATNSAEAYSIMGNKALEAQQATRDLSSERALNVVDTIQSLLDQDLSKIAGTSFTGRGLLKGGKADLRAELDNFIARGTLQNLVELKERGGTLGALSEKELEMLNSAFIAITRNAKGNVTMSDSGFRKILEDMQTASMKVYVASQLGKEASKSLGLSDMTRSQIQNEYNILLQQSKQPTSSSPSASFFGDTTSFIGQEEGLRTTAYKDPAGVWTIGYGTTRINGRPVREGDTITPQQASQLMAQDILRHQSYKNRITTNLTPAQQTALSSFEYNLGSGIWNKPSATNIIDAINRGDFRTAGQLMLSYNKARNPKTGQLETLPGLIARRQREAQLLLS